MEDRVVKGDLVLKTILRTMRRCFLDHFNEETNYNTTKRHKRVEYIYLCLEKFVKDNFYGMNSASKALEIEDLIFTFGSFFYPKDMRALHKG